MAEDRDSTAVLHRALQLAEDALIQAKLALAAGDLDAANAALTGASEAHDLAQRLRADTAKRPAA